ncbi:MAG: uroporphyrinogen decarboxylase family protein [Planctomycetota bacterium]
MNGRERVLAAIAHREPDRLPATFDAEAGVKEVLKRHFGVRTDDELWRSLGVDTRLVGADHHHTPPGPAPEGITLAFWGYGMRAVRNDFGETNEIVYHPLAAMETPEQIAAFPWPDAGELTFDAIRRSRRENPDAAIIAHITHGGYFNGTFMRGMEEFLVDLAGRPEMAEAVLAKATGYLFPAVERLCREAGDAFDIYYLADDFCTAQGPLVSPPLFRKYIKPYLARIARIVHAHGKFFLLHVCGSVRLFIPDLIEAGVDLLEPIQTTATGMEPEGLKRDFGDRLTFYGSIDLIHVLRKGSPGDVRAEVRRMFHVLGKGGGFIVGPSHTYIQPDVPLENILAMYATAGECRYAHDLA